MVLGVDALLVVDSPELGMRLIAVARVERPVFYLAPLAAWRDARLPSAQDVHMGWLPFDFEARWYQGRGVEAVCVGIRSYRKLSHGWTCRRVARPLPGSRQGYAPEFADHVGRSSRFTH